MTRSQKFLLSGLLVASLALVFGLLARPIVQAQTVNDLGVNYVATTGLSAQDPRLTVAKIIRVGLGLLGTIAVVLVIYAGFLWMTAAGNQDKIKRAKDVLRAAVIGLVIILSAFAITSFIISQLLEATNGPGGGNIVDPEIVYPRLRLILW
jgi:type IV secretory pathway VirB2 component (pilin)